MSFHFAYFSIVNFAFVNFSGSTSGLSLVLNVEQYEYMRGPQNDAGIKVNNFLYHANKTKKSLEWVSR